MLAEYEEGHGQGPDGREAVERHGHGEGEVEHHPGHDKRVQDGHENHPSGDGAVVSLRHGGRGLLQLLAVSALVSDLVSTAIAAIAAATAAAVTAAEDRSNSEI